MTESVENLILAQLRDIRGKLDVMDDRLATVESEVGESRMKRIEDKVDEALGKVLASITVVRTLAEFLGRMNEPVEHIEERLGVTQ